MNNIPEYFSENVLTVSELNGLVKELFDNVPVFSYIKLRGEISNFTNHRSGHFYFTLKDDNAALKAVMFKGSNAKLKFLPENGMRVVATGRLGVFERDGVYQLYVSDLAPDGVGALYIAYEKLKKKLEAEGLFDQSGKMPIPKFPRSVGVITSPTGAAVRDIINVTGRRYPLAEIKVFPALVQGDGAVATLIAGIEFFNREQNADVIIIGRGGGSIEDLWAFNSEELARTIAASGIPVISAVGHETDFTICDFVSDLRAPTPSAAAEIAVPDAEELRLRLTVSLSGIERAVRVNIRRKRDRVDAISAKRVMRSPDSFLDYRRETLDRVSDKLFGAFDKIIERKRSRLAALAGRVDALSPLAVLTRGYGAAFGEDGKPITKAASLPKGKRFTLRLSDGAVTAVSEGTANAEK